MTDHVLELRGAIWWPPPYDDPVVGLLLDLEAVPIVMTGIADGPVDVTVERLDDPPALDPEGWEDVVEISIVAGDRVHLLGMEDPQPADSRLNRDGPGWYRLRIHATGRDIAYDSVVEEPVERYLVQSWPAPPRGPSGTGAVTVSARHD